MAGRNILKGYFKTGDKPTQSQFAQFIDSVFNLSDDSKATIGLGNVPNVDATDPSNINENTTHRFVTDSEKTTWNAKQNALGFTPENSANKNAVNGYAGLASNYAIQLKNALGTFISTLRNSNTAARSYDLPDRNGTLADDTDISGLQTQITNLNPQVAPVSGTCGEVPNKNIYVIDDTGGNADFTIDPFGGSARIFDVMRVGSGIGNTVTIKAAAGGSVNGVANFTLAAAYNWARILVPAGSNDCLVFLQ